eukprot:2239921-Karenia_brevis.AAC.1
MQQSEFLNPRAGATYIPEDFVGKICDMAMSCCKNNGSLRLSVPLAEKYQTLLHLLFEKMLETDE